MLIFLALATTLGAVLISSTATAVLRALREALQARRRAQARADEVALIAASAQRWHTAPTEWGGGGGAFAGASFQALGLPTNPLAPARRRTPNGVYRIVHVPSCDTLDLAAERTGVEAGRDGLLVVGWDPASGQDTAAIVLGPLVQVPLARVPWAWIAHLDALAGRQSADKAERPAGGTDRARPRMRSAPDRTAVPALRLVHWPDRPAHPTIGDGSDRAPPELEWQRAA